MPEVLTFNMLLHVCCKSASQDRLWPILARMGQLGIQPNPVTINTLQTSFTGDRNQLDQVLSELFK